jgi:hypothetical protein
LHRRRKDWRRAASDLERAVELGASEDKVRLTRAMFLLDNGKGSRVIETLAGLEGVPAHFLRGRALARLEDVAGTSAAFSRAIASCEQPIAEHFIEHARMLATAEPQRIDEALGVIGLGLKTLGPIISLNQEAFRLERHVNPAAALRRACEVNRGDAPPNPRWLIREVELLLDLNELDQASSALASVRAKLDALPARRRATPAIRKLCARLDSLAKSLEVLSERDRLSDGELGQVPD